jgi:hypothetical protein
MANIFRIFGLAVAKIRSARYNFPELSPTAPQRKNRRV